MATKLTYRVDFVNQSKILYPFIDTLPFEGFPADYLNDPLSKELISIISLLKQYSQLRGEEALLYLSDWVFKKPKSAAIEPFLLKYFSKAFFGILIKSHLEFDNLQIVYDLASNELIFYDGLFASFEGSITADNPLRRVNLEQWLFLWDWWQEKKAAGLKLESGTIEIPIAPARKTSIYKPLVEYLKKDIHNWVEQNDFWVTEEETAYDFLQRYINDLEKKIDFLTPKIATLRELSARRPLLAREQTELAFLEKIQAADSLESLETLDNELTNTATDPELKARLQKYVADKMDFY